MGAGERVEWRDDAEVAVSVSRRRHKLDSARSRDWDRCSSRREPAGFIVDAEDDGVVALLVGADEPMAGWVKGKIARGLAERRSHLDEGQHSRPWVDRENGDGIGPAVGGVEKFSVGMDHDFRGGVLAGEIFREG